jgi:hypothetical protein
MYLPGRLQQQILQGRVQVFADHQTGRRGQDANIFRRQIAHQIGHALRHGQTGHERVAALVSGALRKAHQLDTGRTQQHLDHRRMLGGNDEGRIDAPLLQFLSRIQAGNSDGILLKIQLVVFQQSPGKLADARAFLTNGNALALQFGEFADAGPAIKTHTGS